jgi:very-short-patch-repair endonuclease
MRKGDAVNSFDQIFTSLLETMPKTESPIEELMLEILHRRLQLRGRVFPQHQITRYRVDFLVTRNPSDRPLIIECDGAQWHSSKEQQKRDYERERIISAKGYDIIRFSGSQIHRRPAEVAARIAEALELPEAEELADIAREDAEMKR